MALGRARVSGDAVLGLPEDFPRVAAEGAGRAWLPRSGGESGEEGLAAGFLPLLEGLLVEAPRLHASGMLVEDGRGDLHSDRCLAGTEGSPGLFQLTPEPGIESGEGLVGHRGEGGRGEGGVRNGERTGTGVG